MLLMFRLRVVLAFGCGCVAELKLLDDDGSLQGVDAHVMMHTQAHVFHREERDHVDASGQWVPKMGLFFNGNPAQSALTKYYDPFPWIEFNDATSHWGMLNEVPLRTKGNVSQAILKWANTFGKERVLMIENMCVGLGKRDATGEYAHLTRCCFNETISKQNPKCTLNQVMAVLQASIDELNGAAKPKYLMGYREPNSDPSHQGTAGSRYQDPDQQARWWAEYFIPAATALNLTLVSQSFAPQHSHWFVDFLHACAESKWTKNENDPDYARLNSTPCNVSAIKIISLHELTGGSKRCKDDYFRPRYAKDGNGSLRSEIVNSLKEKSNSVGMDWAGWIAGTKYWIHAFNCVAKTRDWSASADKSICEVLTEHDPRDGLGSVYAMNELNTVERWQYVNVAYLFEFGCNLGGWNAGKANRIDKREGEKKGGYCYIYGPDYWNMDELRPPQNKLRKSRLGEVLYLLGQNKTASPDICKEPRALPDYDGWRAGL
jgi:hypothetical protein